MQSIQELFFAVGARSTPGLLSAGIAQDGPRVGPIQEVLARLRQGSFATGTVANKFVHRLKL